MDNRREGKVGLRTGPRGKLNNIVGFFFGVGRLGDREFWGRTENGGTIQSSLTV